MASIALVMIARNEARCIKRCLSAAREFVDEMIVLDTGSTDGTVDLAREAGAKVRQADWTDDFAAARNAALAFSTSDWNLVLDADEWIDGGSPAALRGLLESAAPFVGLIPVINEFDLDGRVEVVRSWLPRLLPRSVRYEGRVHEQPVWPGARLQVQLPVRHDGYRAEGLQQKKGRNEALLLRVLQEEPDDPYYLYQLGKNYEVYEDYPLACEYFRRALAKTGEGASFRHDLVIRTISSLKSARMHEEAIHLCSDEMARWGGSPDFFFVFGDLMLDWAILHPAQAEREFLPMVEASWLRCLEIGDQPGLCGSVLGRGSHLAAHNLAVMYETLGDAERARHFRALAGGMR